MSGYEKEMSLFYHLIVWIGWIKVFPLMKKVEKEMLIPIVKVRLLGQFLQILIVMMVTMGAVGKMVALLGVVDELVALVRELEEIAVLEEMVALGVVMLVK